MSKWISFYFYGTEHDDFCFKSNAFEDYIILSIPKLNQLASKQFPSNDD